MPSASENSDAVRRLIKSQLAQIEQEGDALRRALDALGAPAPASASASAGLPSAGEDDAEPDRRRRPRRHARPSTSAAIVPAGKLEALLAAGNGRGLTTSNLARETGGRSDQILALLRELEDAGRVRRSGQKRGTRWHLVTEDDLVAERAAQLAAQSRRAAAEEDAAMAPHADPPPVAAGVPAEVAI